MGVGNTRSKPRYYLLELGFVNLRLSERAATCKGWEGPVFFISNSCELFRWGQRVLELSEGFDLCVLPLHSN